MHGLGGVGWLAGRPAGCLPARLRRYPAGMSWHVLPGWHASPARSARNARTARTARTARPACVCRTFYTTFCRAGVNLELFKRTRFHLENIELQMKSHFFSCFYSKMGVTGCDVRAHTRCRVTTHGHAVVTRDTPSRRQRSKSGRVIAATTEPSPARPRAARAYI